MEYSEESFENVEAKKPSVPDLGAQILVEISRWLLDQPREFAVKFGPEFGLLLAKGSISLSRMELQLTLSTE